MADKFEAYTMKAHGICKICEEQIDKDTLAIRLDDVHISPKRKALFFHTECFKEAIKEFK